tara:strand:- start:14 stop:271 length:258 start_codon:yes stop_codon:yes gene_type:complete
MSGREKQIAECTQNFLSSLPKEMKNGHIGAVICTILEAFDLDHEERAQICEGVVNVMLEVDLRSDERAAQAADAVLARAAAKARK